MYPKHIRHFNLGKTYLRKDGKPVTIIAETYNGLGYGWCVQGDDGEDRWEDDEFIPGSRQGWRYDRDHPLELGRVTGGTLDDPRCLVPYGTVEELAQVGLYFVQRFKEACEDRGPYRAAANARKQGWPFAIVHKLFKLAHR